MKFLETTLCFVLRLCWKKRQTSFLLGNRIHPCSYPDSTDKHLLLSKGPMQGQPQRCLSRAGPCHNQRCSKLCQTPIFQPRPEVLQHPAAKLISSIHNRWWGQWPQASHPLWSTQSSACRIFWKFWYKKSECHTLQVQLVSRGCSQSLKLVIDMNNSLDEVKHAYTWQLLTMLRTGLLVLLIISII